jgi:hypothetical protein
MNKALAVFIDTQKLGGDQVGLQIREEDGIVSVSAGSPIVTMRLNKVQDLIKDPAGNIKIKVYRTTDEEPELVGIFSYPAVTQNSDLVIRMKLPKFNNQSENYQFVIHDTNGVPQGKFTHSFAASELVDNQPDLGIPVQDPQLFSQEEIEYIVSKLSIGRNPSGPAGLEKNLDNTYTLKMPTSKQTASSNKTPEVKNISGLNFDEIGSLEDKSLIDDAPKGTVFLDETSGNIYIKKSQAAADWSNPISLRGPKGDKGDTSNGTAFNPVAIPKNSLSLDQLQEANLIKQALANINNLSSISPAQINANSVELSGKSNASLSNLNNVAINSPLLPQNNNAIDLGSSNKRFANAFIAGNAEVSGAVKTNYIKNKTLNLGLQDALKLNRAQVGTIAGGTIPVLRYANGGSAIWSITAPKDLVKNNPGANSVKVKVFWNPSNSLGNGLEWQLSYASHQSGDVVSAASFANNKQTVSAPAQTLAMTVTEFNIAVSAIKDTVVLKLGRVDNNDLNVNVTAISLEYPALGLEEL